MDQNGQLDTATLVTIQWKTSLGENFVITTYGHHLGEGLFAILHRIQCDLFRQGVQLATSK